MSKMLKNIGLMYVTGLIITWTILTVTIPCPKPINQYDIRTCGDRVAGEIYVGGMIWPFYWLFRLTHP